MVDNLTPQQRSLTMSRIRARDTKVELAVRRALHKRGHRYLVNVAWLPGKPDIVFTKARLAVLTATIGTAGALKSGRTSSPSTGWRKLAETAPAIAETWMP